MFLLSAPYLIKDFTNLMTVPNECHPFSYKLCKKIVKFPQYGAIKIIR